MGRHWLTCSLCQGLGTLPSGDACGLCGGEGGWYVVIERSGGGLSVRMERARVHRPPSPDDAEESPRGPGSSACDP